AVVKMRLGDVALALLEAGETPVGEVVGGLVGVVTLDDRHGDDRGMEVFVALSRGRKQHAIEKSGRSMEKTDMAGRDLTGWLDRQTAVPLVFAEAEQGEVLQTEPRALLELVLVLRGRFVLRVGDRERELEPGDVAWINAHHGNRAELAGTGAKYACLSL